MYESKYMKSTVLRFCNHSLSLISMNNLILLVKALEQITKVFLREHPVKYKKQNSTVLSQEVKSTLSSLKYNEIKREVLLDRRVDAQAQNIFSLLYLPTHAFDILNIAKACHVHTSHKL